MMGLIDFLGGLVILFHWLKFEAFAGLAGFIANVVLDNVRGFASWCASLPFARVGMASKPVWMYFFYYGILFALVFRKKMRIKLRYIAAITAGVCVAVVILQNFEHGKMTITMLDVGQGDCILIQTPGKKNILIDGGKGNINVADCLLALGVERVDYAIITHSDSDHMNGVVEAAKSLDVRTVFVNCIEEDSKFAVLQGIPGLRVLKIGEGDAITPENDCRIEILSPSKSGSPDLQNAGLTGSSGNAGSPGNTAPAGNIVTAGDTEPLGNADLPGKTDSRNVSDNNEDSLVAKLVYKRFSALFMGDADINIEKQLIEKSAFTEQVSLLKVGHHGSKSATSGEFLDAVSPGIAIIGVGKNNMYGHPSREVLDSLSAHRVNVYRTDICGAIIVQTDGEGIWVKTMICDSVTDNKG